MKRNGESNHPIARPDQKPLNTGSLQMPLMGARVAALRASAFGHPRGETARSEAKSHALWALAFRPFFLLAGVAAVLLVAAWLGVYTGILPVPRYFPSGAQWHAHEMLLGFAVTVVVGFLMTASANWTGIRGVHGWKLQLLAGLWLAARVLPWVTPPQTLLYPVVDLAFLPLAGVFLAPYLLRKEQKRNKGFIALLGVLTVAALLIHLDAWGVSPGAGRRGALLALDVVVVIVTVIGGRVLPMFARNAIPEVKIRGDRRLDLAAIGATAAFAVAELVAEGSTVACGVAFVAAALNGARLWLWDPLQTRRNAMVWILFSGYAWLVAGLLLKGFAFAVAPGIAVHALAVGAVGGLIYGMMPRVSLGHTGRKIAASKPLVAGFYLVNAAAFVRVAVAGLLPEAYVPAVVAAGVLWIAAFALFTAKFVPVLTRPRVDGKPG